MVGIQGCFHASKLLKDAFFISSPSAGKMSETNAQSVSELVGEGKRAKLVMGEPLGGEAPMEGDSFKPEDNEEILVDLPDSATELELTHLRLRTLRGLQLQRFTQVIVSPPLSQHTLSS